MLGITKQGQSQDDCEHVVCIEWQAADLRVLPAWSCGDFAPIQEGVASEAPISVRGL